MGEHDPNLHFVTHFAAMIEETSVQIQTLPRHIQLRDIHTYHMNSPDALSIPSGQLKFANRNDAFMKLKHLQFQVRNPCKFRHCAGLAGG